MFTNAIFGDADNESDDEATDGEFKIKVDGDYADVKIDYEVTGRGIEKMAGNE